jgi:hypothetical protein
MVTKCRNMQLYLLQLDQGVVKITVWPLRFARLLESSHLVIKVEILF